MTKFTQKLTRRGVTQKSALIVLFQKAVFCILRFNKRIAPVNALMLQAKELSVNGAL